MNFDSLLYTFRHNLTPLGLSVLRLVESDKVAALVVGDGTPASGMALFQAADPEFIGIVLANGAEYWENEWSDQMQLELARDYASIVSDYVDGRPVPKPKTVIRKQQVLKQLLDIERFKRSSG